MPSWKKVITSGSSAAFSSLIVSNTITGSISGSLTGSLQGTASWAEYVVNGGSINTSSLVTISSFNAFTSSINAFTASYNTGSFSGSFTGSLNGTASWAENASQALVANVLSTYATINQINNGEGQAFIRTDELEQSKHAALNIYNYTNFT